LFSFNNVSWTLSIEALFYAVFPLVALLFGRYIYKASVARAAIWAFALWALMVVMSITLPLSIQATPPLQLPEFLIGSLAAYIFINRSSLWVISNEKRATLTEAISVAAVGLSMAISAALPSTEAVAVSLAPALMFMIVVFAYQQGHISRYLAKRPFVFLGEISFSFYMLHMIILRGMGGIGNPKLAILALAATLGLSILTFNFVEEPVRKLIRRYTDYKITNRRRKLGPEQLLEPSSNF
jgi:peptidoglycan/LPS O-acetylase OafA/YrhL